MKSRSFDEMTLPRLMFRLSWLIVAGIPIALVLGIWLGMSWRVPITCLIALVPGIGAAAFGVWARATVLCWSSMEREREYTDRVEERHVRCWVSAGLFVAAALVLFLLQIWVGDYQDRFSWTAGVCLACALVALGYGTRWDEDWW